MESKKELERRRREEREREREVCRGRRRLAGMREEVENSETSGEEGERGAGEHETAIRSRGSVYVHPASSLYIDRNALVARLARRN